MNRVVGTSVFSKCSLWGLFSFVCFLFFTRTKTTKTQNKQFSRFSKFFSIFKVFMRTLLVGFGLWRIFGFFCAGEIFLLKKNKVFKTALITLFTLLLSLGFIHLTHYSPVLLFHTPENIRKPKGFLMFSGGIEKQHRAVMG